jgi:hypothetical protein
LDQGVPDLMGLNLETVEAEMLGHPARLMKSKCAVESITRNALDR